VVSEIVVLAIVVLGALLLVLRSERRLGARLAIGLVILASTSAFAFSRSQASGSPPPPPPHLPKATTALGYVTSSRCLGCHPGEHASWSRTYHRTMTQVASSRTVLASLNDPSFPLERRSDSSIWATLPDPDLVIENKLEPPPLVSRQVVMTTGSHREQAFWVAGRREGDLRLVPFVWLIKEKSFLPRREAFLLPPDVAMPPVRWNSSCIACHAVGGEPRHSVASDAFDTRAVDLGIACEACHGPGAEHVERFRDPVARYLQHARKGKGTEKDKEKDKDKSFESTRIIHPKRISAERSAALCGQCHAYAFPKDENAYWSFGYSRAFRAGDALEPSRTLFRLDTKTVSIDAPVESLFWPDGSVRVGGREYNGLIESPCYVRGTGERKMTCVSCHSMHAGDPRGQINPELLGNKGCTSSSCHATTREHSHHAAGSVGSACVSCHMPKTSYALLSAVRSHRIDSPSAWSSGGKQPNACNLCHLDRSLAWTEKTLHEWFGRGLRAKDEDEIPFGLRAGIAGDASVRALIADALGSPDAIKAAANADTLRAIVDQIAIHETYPAVSFIAKRSQARLPPAKQAPLDPTRLLQERDQRPIMIAE
jgi:hypothetical protein